MKWGAKAVTLITVVGEPYGFASDKESSDASLSPVYPGRVCMVSLATQSNGESLSTVYNGCHRPSFGSCRSLSVKLSQDNSLWLRRTFWFFFFNLNMNASFSGVCIRDLRSLHEHWRTDCCLVSKSCPDSATPWAAAQQASLSFNISWSLLKVMSIESVMPSNHLILCHPLLFLPSIFPSIRVFSKEWALCIRWPKYWSFSFIVSPSNEYSMLNNFKWCVRSTKIMAVKDFQVCFASHSKPIEGPLWYRAGFFPCLSFCCHLQSPSGHSLEKCNFSHLPKCPLSMLQIATMNLKIWRLYEYSEYPVQEFQADGYMLGKAVG